MIGLRLGLRRMTLAALASLLALVGALALGAGAAEAEIPKLISYGNFGSNTTAPVGVAVDQASHDVYVAGFVNFQTHVVGHVAKFDAAGKLISPPSPFATGLQAGATVNPANGDLYVQKAYPLAIETYDPNTGARLGTPFAVPNSNNFAHGGLTAVEIASGPSGNVYVPVVHENKVLEYSPTGTLEETFTDGGTLKEPSGVAVDSAGDVWIADTGNNRIVELDSSGAPVEVKGKPVEIKSEGVRSVALDEHGNVFAMVFNSADSCGSLPASGAGKPQCSHLEEYSSGVKVADVGAGSFAAPPEGVAMLAVNDTTDHVYVTDFGHELVWVFGPPTKPEVVKELTAEVSATEAKLGALVKPGGIATSYRFEYGTTTGYGQVVPFPEGTAGTGLSARTVWAAASGLAPATTYHYRVVATNAVGTEAGPDQTFTTAPATTCPNEAFRTGFSANLPDCRAYEVVSPVTKESTQPVPFGGHEYKGLYYLSNVASQGEEWSDAMGYASIDILPTSGAETGGLDYLATRGSSGWSSENMIPLQSYSGLECPRFRGARIVDWAANMAQSVLTDNGKTRASASDETFQSEGGCGAEPVEVVPGEPQGYQNLLLRDNETGEYQLINAPETGVTPVPADAHLQAASTDLRHVVFVEHAQLTKNAPGGVEDLYEWARGEGPNGENLTRLVTVLPDGTPAVGSLATAPEEAAQRHAVSSDGSHVFFTANGRLYVRIDGARTVWVDEPQGGSGAGGEGVFQGASATDGSRAFFTDDQKLTAGATAEPGKPDLYECALPAGTSRCELTDLTSEAAVATAGEHADVMNVSAINQDGSRIYLIAGGVLAEGAKGGEPNLYLWADGKVTFIATLGSEDVSDAATGRLEASPNGGFLGFSSERSLTGYDNTDAKTGLADREIFLYDAGSNQLACISCKPSGEAPSSANNAGDAAAFVAAEAERKPLANEITYLGQTSTNLYDNGRVFFTTAEALLPSDTNGQKDVYEYEEGQLHLISTGTSADESVFVAASETGNDAFFLTRQSLLPSDTTEEERSIYDARVYGGFPEPVTPPSCTTADACRTPVSPQPSIYGSPSSQTFSGEGNLTPGKAHTRKPKLTRKQKLKRAMHACRHRFRHNGHRRRACIRRARRRYGGKHGRRAKHAHGASGHNGRGK